MWPSASARVRVSGRSIASATNPLRLTRRTAISRSTLAATACWLLSPGGVCALAAYLAAGGERDALGHFLPWRIGRATVRGIAYSGTWFDIGDPESYAAACAHFG